MEYKKRSTIYTVLILSIIVAIVISLLGNLLNFNFLRNVVDSDVIEANRSTSEIAFANIERQLESIVRANAVIMINSPKLEEAIKKENANAIVQNISALSSIADAIPAVSSYDISFPSSKAAIVNSTHLAYNITEDERRKSLPWLKQYEESGENFLILPLGRNNWPESKLNLTYVARNPLPSQNAQSIIAFHINPDFFRTYINESNGSFLILDRDLDTIYETPGDDYSAFARGEIREKGGGPEVLSYAKKRNGEKLYITMKTSPAMPLHFMYIRPSSTSNHFIPYMQSFLANAAILIVANLIIIPLLTIQNDKVYRNRLSALVPAKERRKNAQKMGFDTISDELERKFKNLNSSYENAQPILTQNTIRMLLLGRDTESGEDKLDDLLPYDYVRVGIARTSSGEPGCLPRTLLAKELGELPQDVLGYITTINNETIIVINSNDSIFGFKDLQERDSGLRLYLSSTHETGAESLKTAYDEAAATLPYKFLYPEKHTLIYRKLDIEHRLPTLHQAKHLNRLDEALLLHSSPDAALEILSSFVDNLISSNVTIEYAKIATRDLVTVFHRSIVNQGLDPIGLFGYDLRSCYSKIEDIRGYEAWIRICLVNYFNYMDELRQKRNENRVREKIDEILRTTPSKLISLKYIASKMDMGPDELSRLFKACYGINYSEYIRDRKMEGAKKLLEEGLMVKEISDELGYNAPQYFIKVFKQATGITPKQYGKLAQGQIRSGEQQ